MTDKALNSHYLYVICRKQKEIYINKIGFIFYRNYSKHKCDFEMLNSDKLLHNKAGQYLSVDNRRQVA